MPRAGFGSISIRKEVYQELWDEWERQKPELIKQGITSFSGFCTKFLYEALQKARREAQQPR